MRKIKNNIEFDIVNYTNIVNNIADEFFDEKGEYTPHVGKLYAMSVFYNECVVEDGNKTKIDDILQVQPLIRDRKFVNAFNKTIKKTSQIRLNFANAYRDALDIVNHRRASFNNAVNIIKNSINDVVDKMNSAMSEDSLSKMAELAQNITNGNLNINSILNNSKSNKKVIDIKK